MDILYKFISGLTDYEFLSLDNNVIENHIFIASLGLIFIADSFRSRG